MAAGNNIAVGTVSGSKTHLHGLNAGYSKVSMTSTVARVKDKEVPAWAASKYIRATEQGASTFEDTYAAELGGSTDTQEILPPHIAANIWRRTA